MNSRWMLTTVMGLGFVAPLRAADAPPPTDTDDKGKQEDTAKPPSATENKGTQKLASKLAGEFNVPEKEILDLRAKGLGWGEIGHALAIAQKANVSVADVLKLRNSGMGWGQIAQKYGFKLGDVTGKAKEVARAGKKAEREDRKGRTERGGGGEREPRDISRAHESHGGGPRR